MNNYLTKELYIHHKINVSLLLHTGSDFLHRSKKHKLQNKKTFFYEFSKNMKKHNGLFICCRPNFS